MRRTKSFEILESAQDFKIGLNTTHSYLSAKLNYEKLNEKLFSTVKYSTLVRPYSIQFPKKYREDLKALLTNFLKIKKKRNFDPMNLIKGPPV